MMIWSTQIQQKSTKSQHTCNTSICAEFDGGFEFSQQMVIWSTKGQHTHNTSKCPEFDGRFEFSQKSASNAQKWLFYTGNWRVGGLFYLTFSLNASKTII